MGQHFPEAQPSTLLTMLLTGKDKLDTAVAKCVMVSLSGLIWFSQPFLCSWRGSEHGWQRQCRFRSFGFLAEAWASGLLVLSPPRWAKETLVPR